MLGRDLNPADFSSPHGGADGESFTGEDTLDTIKRARSFSENAATFSTDVPRGEVLGVQGEQIKMQNLIVARTLGIAVEDLHDMGPSVIGQKLEEEGVRLV